MRQLFLHIGYPKTGTTSVQRFLALNQAALQAAGVLYPQAGRIRHGDAHYGVNFALGIADYDRPKDVEKPVTLRQDLAAEAAGSGCEKIVLSTEYLTTANLADKARVRAYFADYDVKIVCYLRRHDHMYESAYAQAVKTVANPPWTDSIEGFIVYHTGMGTVSYDYLGVLRQWAQHFGTAAILVRPFEPAQNTPDVYADFLATIGVADSAHFVRPKRANPSITPRTAAAIGMLRRTGLAETLKRAIIGHMIVADARMELRHRYLSPAMCEALVRRYAPVYRGLAREFLGREDGVLFREPAPDAKDPWSAAPQWSADELAETILGAVAGRIEGHHGG